MRCWERRDELSFPMSVSWPVQRDLNPQSAIITNYGLNHFTSCTDNGHCTCRAKRRNAASVRFLSGRPDTRRGAGQQRNQLKLFVFYAFVHAEQSFTVRSGRTDRGFSIWWCQLSYLFSEADSVPRGGSITVQSLHLRNEG